MPRPGDRKTKSEIIDFKQAEDLHEELQDNLRSNTTSNLEKNFNVVLAALGFVSFGAGLVGLIQALSGATAETSHIEMLDDAYYQAWKHLKRHKNERMVVNHKFKYVVKRIGETDVEQYWNLIDVVPIIADEEE